MGTLFKKLFRSLDSLYEFNRISEVWLSVLKNNIKAVNLYRKCGFEATANIKYNTSKELCLQFMSLDLTEKRI